MSLSSRLAGAALAALLAAGCTPSRPAAAEARAKLAALEDVLRARDDNDPRLDREFEGLSPEAKARFREAYAALAPERRNERGTIVYLLGRNLSAPEDWAFLAAVAGESPCLSLADCARPSAQAGGPGDEVTLAYPALVAVRQAARAARAGGSKEGTRRVLEAARGSRSPAVTRLARGLDAASTAP